MSTAMSNSVEFCARMPFRMAFSVFILLQILIGNEMCAVGMVIDWYYGKYLHAEYWICFVFWLSILIGYAVI